MFTVEHLNGALEPLSIPLANLLGLPRLPSYFGFHVIERFISPWLFGRLYPEHYGKASPRVRQGWATRACSMVHAIGVVYLAARAINREELIRDKIRGTHPTEGLMEAFSAGFIWDAMEETLFHYQDLGLALHG
ncbi:hypothetical protein Clacol_006825 [Clathrus columnatus]|uniref:Uncharacterized protein n=1 Tax=Clathrus columnatus TaxID=1419009 RepID=A0AAV5AG01_9AGAM|nr:hypothetical protein Clacol_006825 [Clathrus columnatus]